MLYDSFVSSLTLSTLDGDPAPGDAAVVAGWGVVTTLGPKPDEPRFASVPVMSNEECSSAYEGVDDHVIDPGMLCAGNGGKDACQVGACNIVGNQNATPVWQGDSGGPLYCEGDRPCGIVSWGESCAQEESPGVSVRVSHFLNWRKEKRI